MGFAHLASGSPSNQSLEEASIGLLKRSRHFVSLLLNVLPLKAMGRRSQKFQSDPETHTKKRGKAEEKRRPWFGSSGVLSV